MLVIFCYLRCKDTYFNSKRLNVTLIFISVRYYNTPFWKDMQKSATFAAVLKRLNNETVFKYIAYPVVFWDVGAAQVGGGQLGHEGAATRYQGAC
jgi:hypothetical protein